RSQILAAAPGPGKRAHLFLPHDSFGGRCAARGKAERPENRNSQASRLLLRRPPLGNYEVETSTEVKRRLSLTLDNNQTRYVRLNMAMGFFVGHVYPELVDDPTGEKEICGCKYTGIK